MSRVRIWVDGCFDTMHYGHANALRQAREMGDVLVVGVHSDQQILENKGPTVEPEEDRYEHVESCKWVDEVVRDAPYQTQLEIMDQFACDFCVHGDDVTTLADGTDCYSLVKNAGRYKECKRTEGISTTGLVQRILDNSHPPSGYAEKWLPIFRNTFPPSGKRVYLDGAFDMFHIGHVRMLKQASEHGHVLVGVFSDEIVVQRKERCVMNVYERCLSALSCRYCYDVVESAPLVITKSFIEEHKIDLVINPYSWEDRFQAAKDMGIYLELGLEQVSSDYLVKRILDNHQLYVARNERKQEKAIVEEQLAKRT
ncbi:hypothetical protein EDD86DRAFT_7199 [Gorgonomyces haynaldii]|nr:hypothetical protein EDD86DRAFT_7199 [Gorgonomyces haynaldii]